MKNASRERIVWSILFRQTEKSSDGEGCYLDGDFTTLCGTRLFQTRDKARDYIQAKYSYHKYLREHPHGFLMPIAVKVLITVKVINE